MFLGCDVRERSCYLVFDRPMSSDGGRAPVVGPGSPARDHTVDVRLGPVLAELELGLDAGDRHLDADDGAELTLDELRGRVVDRPGNWASTLGVVGETA